MSFLSKKIITISFFILIFLIIIFTYFNMSTGGKYKHFNSMTYEQKIEYGKTLTARDWVDLEKYIYENSSGDAPSPLFLSDSRDKKEIYAEVIKKIKRGDKGLYLMNIITYLNQNNDFNICNKDDHIYVQHYYTYLAKRYNFSLSLIYNCKMQ